jgi:hypothetical protein
MSPLRPLPAAAVGALALAVPVTAETLVDIGDTWWGHTLFVASQLVGWTLLASVVASLRRVAGGGSRGRRVGSWLTVAGCALQLTFALAYAATVVLSGQPNNLVFVPFSLAFLALTVGGTTWGLALRGSDLDAAGHGLLVVALLGLAAILVALDPWHDIALVGSYLSWVLVGRATAQSSSSSASARSSLAVGRAALGSGWRPAR